MNRLLAICLSLGLAGCVGLPQQPDGWMCIFYTDTQTFFCNRIKNPEVSQEFQIQDPVMRNAHCQDTETFKAYTDYVTELKRRLIRCQEQ